MGSERERLQAMQPALLHRARVLQGIRRFFAERDFLEVETPVHVAAPAQETHIDAEPTESGYLRTSPELHMKRMLAAGYERIYQLGPCFRRGERGALHHPEFCMLEWYRAGTDYLGILEDTRALLVSLDSVFDVVWKRVTVEQAFAQWAGWNPVETYDADRFDLDLVERVEPALAQFSEPVILTDYPAEAGALARLKPGDTRVAERWELYWKGVELANAYSELTDAVEQDRRFEQAAQERTRLGKPVYPLDQDFMDALRAGLPPCGGIALGVDRLAMTLFNATSLSALLPFR